MAPIKAGFIGLGNLGMPMAKKIVKKGIPLRVYDLRKELVDQMTAQGAVAATSAKEVAAMSDVIISMVNDIADTDAVIFGKDGVWDGINKGAIIVITSTLGPSYCQNLYEKAKERGIRVIDAPVSKNGPNNDGELTLMIGGDDDAVARCRLIFEALATHPFHLGGIGTGQTYKLINNLLSGSLVYATRESLDLGLRAGLDLEKMIEVMRVGTGNNWNLSQLDYLIKSYKTRAAASAPKPTKNIASKDWNLALELAKKTGARLPLGQFIHEFDPKTEYHEFYTVMQSKGMNL
jgi:3-hydroxyisobutyrate dehydrogenase-like beta-hydroxyacid dehydrogenase